MLKIRLRRVGAIRQPHYRIVVADARSPRDGRFLESLGHYNPLTHPATIQIDVAKYEEWKKKGAQPTEAVESLVRQFNRNQRLAAAAGTSATPASRRTRTASGKGMSAQETAASNAADAAAADAAETASAATGEAPIAEAPVVEPPTVEPPAADQGSAAETRAELTRGEGETSDAIIGESALEGTSANSGAAREEI